AGTGVAYEGPMMAYRDGSLGGAGYGPSQAFRDGSLGESGSGPLMSYQDGSLGMPLFLETQQGLMQMEDPLVIRHGNLGEYFSGTGEYYEANRGTGEYFAATNGLRGCSSCGQASATAPVLNLADP